MSKELTTTENISVQTKSENLTNSERFTQKVLAEFQGNVGQLNLNEYQKQLIRGYFIGIDEMLKKTEEKRIQKNKNNKDHKWDNNLPYTWNNISLNDLAIAVVHHAKLGLDMQISNHLNAIPYKNNTTGKYDIGFIKGYKGLEYIATQLSLYPIKDIVIELTYSNDIFEIVNNNNKTTYNFTIKNPFDRGEFVGGFGYIQYFDDTKNKIVVLTKKDIEKRKPKTASAEFWGGEKTKYEDGKQVKEQLEGWYEEMARKTVARATYNMVPIDPKKVNDSYAYVVERDESTYENIVETQVSEEIQENANRETIDIETGEIIDNIPNQEEITEEQKETMFPPVADEEQEIEKADW